MAEPSPLVAVNQAYQDSIAQLQATVESLEASPAQKQAARAALDDLFLIHGAQAIQKIEGRTALLTALIFELEGVISRIKARPFGDAVSTFTNLVDRARSLYESHKEELKSA